MKKSAAASPKRTVIVDAGPLKAAIDRGDPDHAWAVRVFRAVPARYITFEAAIAEAQHGFENHPTAMRALRKLVARMDIVAVATALIQPVFDEVRRREWRAGARSGGRRLGLTYDIGYADGSRGCSTRRPSRNRLPSKSSVWARFGNDPGWI